MSNSKLRVAIIGGGLAGLITANALLQIPHLDIKVFEAGPDFSERGAAVGLSSNARIGLEKILGKAVCHEMLARASAVWIASTRLVIVSLFTK